MGSNSNSIMKKIIYLISIIIGIIGIYSTALSAPLYRFERTLLPEASVSYDIGSGSLLWNNGYFNNLTVSGTCTGCGTGSGGGLGWASTTIPNSNSIYSTALSNVGIGTSSPLAKLDIYSTDQAILRADSNSTTGTRVIISNSNNSSLNNNYGFVQGGTGVYKDKFQIARMNYNMGINSNIITMDSNSNVGIGTTSPLSRLHVVGANDFVYGQELTYPLWVSSPSNSLKSTIIGYNLDKDVGVIDAVDRGVSFKNLVLQSTGKFLGVGTTTPWGTLSVAGTNGQTTAVPVFVVSTSTSVFATTTALIVDGSGRVGVATKSPVTPLTIGAGALLQTPNGAGTVTTPDLLVTNTSKIAIIAAGVADGANNRRVGLFVDDTNSIAGLATTYGGSSFPFIFRDAGGERIRFDTNGNVNIGTSTTVGQSAQLSIRNTSGLTNAIQLFSGTSNTTLFSVNGTNGNVTMAGSLSATGGSVTTVNGVFNSSAGVVPVKANGSASQTADLFQAQKNSVNFAVINADGDIGSGTSTPMARLSATAKNLNDVSFALQGLTGQTGNLISIYPSNSSTTVFSMNPTGGIFANSASTTLYFAGLTSSGTGNAVCITTNNQITNAGSGTCTPSSEKYKNSIKDFSGNALEELNKLKIVTFNYNDDVKTINEGDTKQRIGMIAEQVEKVDPRLVVHKDGSPNSLNDRDLLSLTIKALQEQQKQIDSLKAEIKRLNNK